MPVVPVDKFTGRWRFVWGCLPMYATCLNYKRDQVHTTAILRRRRWRGDAPRHPITHAARLVRSRRRVQRRPNGAALQLVQLIVAPLHSPWWWCGLAWHNVQS